VRILAVQETDWIGRNPILHHRMLEELSRDRAEVIVLDYDILWRQKGVRPLWQPRSVVSGHFKYFANSRVTLIRPAMIRIPGFGRASWLVATWMELRALLDRWHPDVVIGYGISNAMLARKMARARGIPFVYHVMDALHTLAEPRALRPIARVVERWVMTQADRVIVVNRRLREYAVAMGALPRRIDVIPMGVLPVKSVASARDVRMRLGIAEYDFVLLFMGWLYTFSGMREIATELGRRVEAFPTVKLFVIGDGDLLPELRRLSENPTLRGRLIVLGRRPVEEMPDFIRASDVGLLPAHRTSAMEYIVPAKVIEYMENGKPVIATRLPGLEAEFGELPGLLYVDRPAEVFDRLQELFASGRPRDAASELGSTCRDLMRSREDWATVTARFEQVLRSV
jgi:glycosyltransferase involved in cell wall biosynthesis